MVDDKLLTYQLTTHRLTNTIETALQELRPNPAQVFSLRKKCNLAARLPFPASQNISILLVTNHLEINST